MFMLALPAWASGASSSVVVNPPFHVEGVGSTFEEAKQSGFVKAIEESVGSVVLNDVRSKNNQIVRNEIIKHSAGYISKYTIDNEEDYGDKVVLKMTVYVNSSRIANRILNEGTTAKDLKGDLLSEKHQSYVSAKQSGDRVLKRLLEDYPNQAFEIKQGPTIFRAGIKREAIVTVPVEIRWSRSYLVAFNEALYNVEDGTFGDDEVIVYFGKDPKKFVSFGEKRTHRIKDRIHSDIIQNAFNQNVFVEAKVYDENENEIYSSCFMVAGQQFALVDDKRTHLLGREVVKNTVDLELGTQLNNSVKIELAIKGNTCYN